MAGFLVAGQLDLEKFYRAAISKGSLDARYFDAVKENIVLLEAIKHLYSEFIAVALRQRMPVAKIEEIALNIFCKALVTDAKSQLFDSIVVDEVNGLLNDCRTALTLNNLLGPEPARSESPVILHASIPSLRERNQRGQHISETAWLTDKDLKDILQKINLYERLKKVNPIQITELNPTMIRDSFDVSTSAVRGLEPYNVSMLLNTGGNHWINAVIRVDAENKLTINVTDSLGINAEKQNQLTQIFTNAFPRHALTLDIPTTAATQTDDWSCGYRAITSLLAEQFPDHPYPGNTREQLAPCLEHGELKTSAQLRDGIFTVLEVQATICAPTAPCLATTKKSIGNTMDWLQTEELKSTTTRSPQGNPLSALKQQYETTLAAKQAHETFTTHAVIDAAFQAILTAECPCRSRPNSIGSVASEHRWTEDQDHILALKLQLAYFDEYDNFKSPSAE